MKKCDYHDECVEKINEKIVDNSILLTKLDTDVSWIKENIKEAINKKKFIISTVISAIAVFISVYSLLKS
jgi:hypothetical protein